MEITAAVVRQLGAPLVMETLELEEPREHEVLVRVVAAGICHTDIGRASPRFNAPVPAVLGHEGAGVVEAVGSAVTSVRPGDHVCLTFDSCGECDHCQAGQPAYCRVFRPLNVTGTRRDGTMALQGPDGPVRAHFFGQSSFATYALASDRNAIPVPADLPLDVLAPLGCGIQTGAGAVLNLMRPPVGSSLVAWGSGSLGLAAVMAARVAGCARIIAVDKVGSRLELARELGATHSFLADTDQLVETIREVTGYGANFALDTTGVASVQRQALASLDELGLLVTAALRPSAELGEGLEPLNRGRSIRGTIEGDAIPAQFLPMLIDLWRQGRFPMDRLITRFPFAEINRAMHAAEGGGVVKPVLLFD